MANVLVVSKQNIEQTEKALNRLLGKWFVGDTTFNGGDVDTFDFLGYTSREADGSNVPTGNYIINADKLIAKLSELSQEELDSIKGRFQNVDMIPWIQANMVDESTVIFYKNDL